MRQRDVSTYICCDMRVYLEGDNSSGVLLFLYRERTYTLLCLKRWV